MLQHNIDRSEQLGEASTNDVIYTLSRELPALVEGTKLVDEEAAEQRVRELFIEAQTCPQSHVLPSPQVYSMNNGSSPMGGSQQ